MAPHRRPTPGVVPGLSLVAAAAPGHLRAPAAPFSPPSAPLSPLSTPSSRPLLASRRLPLGWISALGQPTGATAQKSAACRAHRLGRRAKLASPGAVAMFLPLSEPLTGGATHWLPPDAGVAARGYRGGGGSCRLHRKESPSKRVEIQRQAGSPPCRYSQPDSSVPSSLPAALAM